MHRNVLDTCLFLLLAMGLFYYATVEQIDRLYWIGVQYCLVTARILHLSLYDYYVVLFVFVMPAIILTLVVLAGVKFVRQRLAR